MRGISSEFGSTRVNERINSGVASGISKGQAQLKKRREQLGGLLWLFSGWELSPHALSSSSWGESKMSKSGI
jgi:hypothetical protein